MKKWAPLAFLFLLLPVFASAAQGTITSPYSIDYDFGGGVHRLQVFTAPHWVKDENTGEWKDFTADVPLISNNTGVFFNFSEGQQRRLAHFPKLPGACGNYQLIKNGGSSWKFGATCNVPAGRGSFARNFSGLVAKSFVGEYGFQTRRFYVDFKEWNINTGAFNSSITFTNFTDGNLQINLSWSSNQSQTIELDPFVSAGVSDDLYVEISLSKLGAMAFLKFPTTAIPPNVKITDAHLYLKLNRITDNSTVMAYNSTTNWNTTDTAAFIAALPVSTTGNTTTMNSSNGMIWVSWNVTAATAWAYSIGANSTIRLNHTNVTGTWNKVNNTRLVEGDDSVCMGNSCSNRYNSSESIGGFAPQLNITYNATSAPQWTNNRTNATVAGLATLFQVNWTAQLGLIGWIFELDNGTGTLVNYSTSSFSGTANTSNNTAVLTSNIGATIRWRVYGLDDSGNMNATTLFTFVTQGNASYITCPDGSYLANQTGQIYFLSNQSGIVTASIRILDENLSIVTNYAAMSSIVKDTQTWFNYTINLSKPGTYWAGFNNSMGFRYSQQIGVVSKCASSLSPLVVYSPSFPPEDNFILTVVLVAVLAVALIGAYYYKGRLTG